MYMVNQITSTKVKAMQAGQTISRQVVVLSVTSFQRENYHIPAKFGPIVEDFVCISMQDCDGQILVNMTKADTKFARDIEGLQSGDTFFVSCKVKELRNDPTYGERVAVTNCVMGGYKVSQNETKKAAKKAARLAALGL